MTITAAIIAHARENAAKLGDTSDAAVIEQLAHMVAAALPGMACGFSRMPPGRPVEIKPKPRSIDE